MANKLLFSRRHIEIQVDRGDDASLELVTRFYPVHSNRSKTKFKVSIRQTPEVLEVFRGVTADNITSAPEAIQGHYFKEMLTRRMTEALLTDGPQELPVVNARLTLDPHQQLGRELARFNDKFGFFYDTRTGKTPMSLAIINDAIEARPDEPWLIICPNKLINLAWLPDTGKFFPEWIDDGSVVNCHANSPEERIARINSKAKVYLTNIESFLKYEPYFTSRGLTKRVVVDESSSLKSNSAKISERMLAVGAASDRFYLLSGTPAPNDESEYYMQLRAIDEYCVPQSFSQYCAHYLIDESRSHNYHKFKMNPVMADAHKAFLKPYAIYIDQSVLELPGREFHRVFLEMPAALKEQYLTMKNKLYVELKSQGEDIQLLAPSIAAKLNKLNQITSGFVIDTQAIKDNKVFDTNDAEWHLLDTYRFDFLEAFLEDPKYGCSGKQVIIWAYYRKEFEVIKERLGERCSLCYGGVTSKKQEQAIKDFIDGKVQYLVANPASADKGLTLTMSHKAIYFSLSYSYELFKQSAERIYGAIRSQPNFCDYYILMASHTIDRIIYDDVLMRKASASRNVMNHLKPSVVF